MNILGKKYIDNNIDLLEWKYIKNACHFKCLEGVKAKYFNLAPIN